MRLANRTSQVEFFKTMLRGEISQRILLIQAASGMGKTSLMAVFAELCPIHAETTILVKIDLKSAQTGIAYIFSKLQSRLGQENFTSFNRSLSKFLSAGVEVSGNQIEGTENQIQVVLSTESKVDSNFRLEEMQRAFFQDLQSIRKPIMMILDTFNAAPASVADWIEGGFLAEVANAKNIRVVIAGQFVPKPTIEWEDIADIHCLNEITDIEAWHLFVQARGFPFERDAVKAFVRVLNGNPDAIMKVLKSHAVGWNHE